MLYEMLTGRRAFEGGDVSDTLAAVLRAEPEWSALPETTPQPIRALLKRCLEKDRQARIGDVAAVLFVVKDHALLATAEDRSNVRPFPRVEERMQQVSVGGGTQPVWTAAGRELIYRSADGAMMSVAVAAQSTWKAGQPTAILKADSYTTTPAGSKS